MVSFKVFFEAFQSNDIDLDRAYEIFRDEYLKSTGKAWDKQKFLHRAKDWQFYGDQNGFIAVRPQKSGYLKLVGTAGSNKSKLRGIQELLQTGAPLWGLVDDKIFPLLQKFGLRGPNMVEKLMIKKFFTPDKLTSVAGGATINSFDGERVNLTYPDIGTVEKILIGTPHYWKKLRGGII